MVKKMTDQEFQQVEASKLAVVDFSATWCGPCKMLAPVLDEVAEEMEGKVDFFKVDIDENPDLTNKFRIQSVPTLIVMKDGEAVDQAVGFQPKEGLVSFLEKYL